MLVHHDAMCSLDVIRTPRIKLKGIDPTILPVRMKVSHYLMDVYVLFHYDTCLDSRIDMKSVPFKRCSNIVSVVLDVFIGNCVEASGWFVSREETRYSTYFNKTAKFVSLLLMCVQKPKSTH